MQYYTTIIAKVTNMQCPCENTILICLLPASRPEHYFNVHSGAVSCVERSPFFREVLLTVGGWTFALWKEGNDSDALIKSCSSSIRLTGGAWSPTRPGACVAAIGLWISNFFLL